MNYKALIENNIFTIWRTNIYISTGIRIASMFFFMMFFCTFVFSQCPNNASFKKSIDDVINPLNKNILEKLLVIQQQMKTCKRDEDSTYMFLLKKIGVAYKGENNFLQAINYTNQSIQVAEKCITNNTCTAAALVNNYYNLFFYYSEIGELGKKFKAIDSCIKYALKDTQYITMVIAPLAEKTKYLFAKGEYSLCIKNAKLGEQIIQQYYHQKDSIDYIEAFVILQANALYFSKEITAAENLLNKKIINFKQTGNSVQLYAFYSLLGIMNQEKSNFSKANLYFKEAYKLCVAFKFPLGVAQNLEKIGTLYWKNLHKPDSALNYYYKALSYKAAADSLKIFTQMGNLYASQKEFNKAQFFFQQAYNTILTGMNETTQLQNSFQFPGFNQLQNLTDLTSDKGDAFVEQYKNTKNENYLKLALAIYKKNDQFLFKIKKEQQLQFNSNLVWRITSRNLYEHAIEACYVNNNIEDAFYFFEKSKSILLNDQINEQRLMPNKDIAKRAEIKKLITELDIKLINLSAASPEYLAIQKKIFDANQALRLSDNDLKNNNAIYYQNYLDTTIVTIEQLRKNILKNKNSLMEIFYGDSAVYVLTINNTHKTLTKINQQLYTALTNDFANYISSASLINKDFGNFIKTAHELYKLIFIENKTADNEKLIISPDGKGFPFEALVMNEDPQHPVYVLNKYIISYAYSAKYLTNQFVTNTTNDNRILGIAPVKYQGNMLATLTGSDLSLKNINAYFKEGNNFTLEGATKNNFMYHFPDYKIIQLYTHAADSSTSGDPIIYFADTTLLLSALITDRNPVTQLVVLSACETANGKLYQGEGIFSFNRGFAALGIPATVSNLWPVDNQSTYQITELFYKYLSQGLPTDEALQKAKLEFISTNSSTEKVLPYYWAATILTGKVDSFQKQSKISWVVISVIVLILLGAGYLGRKYFV